MTTYKIVLNSEDSIFQAWKYCSEYFGNPAVQQEHWLILQGTKGQSQAKF